jgi:hypothetical protein
MSKGARFPQLHSGASAGGLTGPLAVGYRSQWPSLPAKFTVTGSPADAAGNIVLVGAGELEGGSPDTDDFSVSIAGVVQPRPA